MKRIGLICLCVFYLVITTGVNLTIHFCGGQIKSVGFLQEEKKRCCGNKAMPVGCCQDEAVLVQLKAAHTLIDAIPISFENTVSDSHSYLFQQERPSSIFISTASLSNNHSPPGVPTQPLYILHRVFII